MPGLDWRSDFDLHLCFRLPFFSVEVIHFLGILFKSAVFSCNPTTFNHLNYDGYLDIGLKLSNELYAILKLQHMCSKVICNLLS